MEGGKIQLVIKGQQDIHLTENPESTFWKAIYKQHTNFSMESICQEFDGQVVKNRVATLPIKMKGDMVYKCYLELQTRDYTTSISDVVNYISFHINEFEIDKHQGEFLDVWSKLTTPKSKEKGFEDFTTHTDFNCFEQKWQIHIHNQNQIYNSIHNNSVVSFKNSNYYIFEKYMDSLKMIELSNTIPIRVNEQLLYVNPSYTIDGQYFHIRNRYDLFQDDTNSNYIWYLHEDNSVHAYRVQWSENCKAEFNLVLGYTFKYDNGSDIFYQSIKVKDLVFSSSYFIVNSFDENSATLYETEYTTTQSFEFQTWGEVQTIKFSYNSASLYIFHDDNSYIYVNCFDTNCFTYYLLAHSNSIELVYTSVLPNMKQFGSNCWVDFEYISSSSPVFMRKNSAYFYINSFNNSIVNYYELKNSTHNIFQYSSVYTNNNNDIFEMNSQITKSRHNDVHAYVTQSDNNSMIYVEIEDPTRGVDIKSFEKIIPGYSTFFEDNLHVVAAYSEVSLLTDTGYVHYFNNLYEESQYIITLYEKPNQDQGYENNNEVVFKQGLPLDFHKKRLGENHPFYFTDIGNNKTIYKNNIEQTYHSHNSQTLWYGTNGENSIQFQSILNLKYFNPPYHVITYNSLNDYIMNDKPFPIVKIFGNKDQEKAFAISRTYYPTALDRKSGWGDARLREVKLSNGGLIKKQVQTKYGIPNYKYLNNSPILRDTISDHYNSIIIPSYVPEFNSAINLLTHQSTTFINCNSNSGRDVFINNIQNTTNDNHADKQYIKVNRSLSDLGIGNNFSLSFWFKRSSLLTEGGGGQCIFTVGKFDIALYLRGHKWRFGHLTIDKLYNDISNINHAGQLTINYEHIPPVDEWFQYIFVFRDNGFKIFSSIGSEYHVDYNRKNEMDPYLHENIKSGVWSIGTYYAGHSTMTGTLDEFYITNKLFTDKEARGILQQNRILQKSTNNDVTFYRLTPKKNYNTLSNCQIYNILHTVNYHNANTLYTTPLHYNPNYFNNEGMFNSINGVYMNSFVQDVHNNSYIVTNIQTNYIQLNQVSNIEQNSIYWKSGLGGLYSQQLGESVLNSATYLNSIFYKENSIFIVHSISQNSLIVYTIHNSNEFQHNWENALNYNSYQDSDGQFVKKETILFRDVNDNYFYNNSFDNSNLYAYNLINSVEHNCIFIQKMDGGISDDNYFVEFTNSHKIISFYSSSYILFNYNDENYYNEVSNSIDLFVSQSYIHFSNSIIHVDNITNSKTTMLFGNSYIFIAECLQDENSLQATLYNVYNSNSNVYNYNSKNVPIVFNPKTLYIPLQFFFCQNPALALPLISLQYSKVYMNVKFGNKVKTGSAKLWIDYVYLDKEERQMMATQNHELLITQLQYTKSNTSETLINFKHPCKELIWRTNSEYDQVEFTLNRQDRIQNMPMKYFQCVQPYQHHTRVPNKNENINVYSFSLHPEDFCDPSGSCNFSKINDSKIKLHGSKQLGLHLWALNWNILRIVSGKTELVYRN